MSSREFLYSNRYYQLRDEAYRKGARVDRGIDKELWERAEAEVNREMDERAQSVTENFWNGPLAEYGREALLALDERMSLQAELELKVKELQADYYARMPKPHQIIDEYNDKRLELLKRRVEEAGLEVCGGCSKAKDDVRLVLLDGQGVGGITDCMSQREWFTRYRHLKKLCPNCRRSHQQPKQARVIDYGEHGETWCNVYPAKERDDGYWAEYEDGWKQIPDDVEYIPVLPNPDSIPRALAAEWNIPPELDSRGNCIVIRSGGGIFEPDIVLTPNEET